MFYISLITALPGSNGDDTSKDSLTVTQDVTLGIEEINELARQMKENADQEDEEIRTLYATSQRNSIFVFIGLWTHV